jgi:enoyl-CoA hydratase/carnithine racemase
MYMREMGSVELLTREGEIEIAKRIEDGLKDMIQAISACPTTIAEIIATSDRIRADELKIDEIVDGLVDDNEDESAPVASDDEDEDEDDEEEGEAEEEEAASGAAAGFPPSSWKQLKRAALDKFDNIAEQFDKMRKRLREGRLQLQSLCEGAGKHLATNCWASASPPRWWKSCATRCAARSMKCAISRSRFSMWRSTSAACRAPLHQGIPGQ